MQIPAWDARLIDLKKAAESKAYCQELIGTRRSNGVEITELATHLQGQLVAVNPVYDEAFDAFAAPAGARQSEGAPAMGGRAGDACRQSQPQSRPRRRM